MNNTIPIILHAKYCILVETLNYLKSSATIV